MSLPTSLELKFMGWAYEASPCVVGPAKADINLLTMGWAGEALPFVNDSTDPSGQPYILRVQGIPGMRTFSQLGHGGI